MLVITNKQNQEKQDLLTNFKCYIKTANKSYNLHNQKV